MQKYQIFTDGRKATQKVEILFERMGSNFQILNLERSGSANLEMWKKRGRYQFQFRTEDEEIWIDAETDGEMAKFLLEKFICPHFEENAFEDHIYEAADKTITLNPTGFFCPFPTKNSPIPVKAVLGFLMVVLFIGLFLSNRSLKLEAEREKRQAEERAQAAAREKTESETSSSSPVEASAWYEREMKKIEQRRFERNIKAIKEAHGYDVNYSSPEDP